MLQSKFFNNKTALLAHGAALAGSILAFRKFSNAITNIDVTRTALDPDAPPASQCNISYGTLAQNAGNISFEYGIYAFFAISFLAHVFYYVDYKKMYSTALAQGWNPYRWVEYALSAGVMTAILAPADGTRDIAHIGTLAVVTAGLQICGYIVEANLKYKTYRNNDVIRASTYLGWILFACVWTPIVYNFVNAVRDINRYRGDPWPETTQIPSWVIFILFSQIIYYGLFGYVQYSHIRDSKSSTFSFASTESKYIALSFMSKISLAAGFAYGLIYRTRDC